MQENFLKTRDKETANKLKQLGFELIKTNDPECFTFINSNKLKFTNEIDQSKIKRSNIVCM